MAYYCFKCRNELEFIVKVGIKVGRQDICPHCTAYLHVCKNCRFYDPALHNHCRLTDADFIKDRETANFCAQFDFRDQDTQPEQDQSIVKAKAKLNDLFKNLK